MEGVSVAVWSQVSVAAATFRFLLPLENQVRAAVAGSRSSCRPARATRSIFIKFLISSPFLFYF
ncbi:hypothetical protein [Methanimicrococcus hongohii]|uniref:hypothetical protein n=1 Tax=Methanimicrococcus hongohii TaxID=3028295 RepID=UPI0029306581|nr:hypothetical protein [Methanimicrococcus sp. Hf6]